MKKIIAIVLAALMLLSLAACAKNDAPTDTTEPDSTQAPETTDGDGETDTIEPLRLLTSIWNAYAEDDRFPAVGGDLTGENAKENEPGVFSIADLSEVDRNLGYPEAQGDQLVAAASLIHMLNGNTFTAGAYQLKSDADMDAVAKALETNIQSRQWVCGFPDRLLVAYVGNCLIGVFGADDLVQAFQNQLELSYSNVVIVSTAAITAE